MAIPVSKNKDKPAGSIPTCHSRYDPEGEARRHLESCLGGRRPALIFILGAGRNFLGKEIRRAAPGSMTVVLQTSPDFDENLVDPGDLYWSPASAWPLEQTLTQALSSGKASGGIGLLEWPPASRGYTARLEGLRKALQQALAIYAAESATSAYWGRRWIRNSIDFACGTGPIAFPGTDQRTLVLACAGPGLADALPVIKAVRNRVRLWALASAHKALDKSGLEPELVLATDPGFWNGAHLALAARKGTMIAATPSTKLGSGILDGSCPLVPLSTSLGFEQDALIAAGDLPGLSIVASGTSAGSALSLASILSFGSIYLCGLDLAARGLAEHVSPYAFDLLNEIKAYRLNPTLTLSYSRVVEGYPESLGPWRLSRAFSTYAFDTAMGIASDRTYRISDSPVDIAVPRISPEQLLSLSNSRHSGSVGPSSETQILSRRSTPKARLGTMLELLSIRSERALAVLRDCAYNGHPVPRDTVLELFAFGGKHCASAITSTARGEASDSSLREAEKGIHDWVSNLARGLA